MKVGAGLVLTAPIHPDAVHGRGVGRKHALAVLHRSSRSRARAAVSRGRRAEFAAHGWQSGDVPDPQDEATFTRSRLDWSEPGAAPHRELLAWYRELISLRRSLPELTDPRLDRTGAASTRRAMAGR